MQYAICNLGIVSLRAQPAHHAEMISQLLYGETFQILEEKSNWSRIQTAFEGLEAWISNLQFQKISEEAYQKLNSEEVRLCGDLVEYVMGKAHQLLPVTLGAVLNGCELLEHQHSCNVIFGQLPKEKLLENAFFYLNAPYLWGGKSPFGIDAGGFTQMVYRLNGYQLMRSPAQQAHQGESLSFIEESEPGDLAFFDDSEGHINHVGIMMRDNYIIHVDGKVRLDRIDHSGIYNEELRKHTHQLRVIKKII